MTDRDHHVVAVDALVAEVDRAVVLVDGDVAGGVAADRGDDCGAVREAAVIGAVDVELRRGDETGELAICEVDGVAAVELHPVAVVDGDGDVRVGIALVRVAAVERTLRGDVGEDETRRGERGWSARTHDRRFEADGDVHVAAAVAGRVDEVRIGARGVGLPLVRGIRDVAVRVDERAAGAEERIECRTVRIEVEAPQVVAARNAADRADVDVALVVDAHARLGTGGGAVAVQRARLAEFHLRLRAPHEFRRARRNGGNVFDGDRAVVRVERTDREVDGVDGVGVVDPLGHDGVDVERVALGRTRRAAGRLGDERTAVRSGVHVEVVVVSGIRPCDGDASPLAGVVSRREFEGEGVAVGAVGAIRVAGAGEREVVVRIRGTGKAVPCSRRAGRRSDRTARRSGCEHRK
jgi:hypothetical protein